MWFVWLWWSLGCSYSCRLVRFFFFPGTWFTLTGSGITLINTYTFFLRKTHTLSTSRNHVIIISFTRYTPLYAGYLDMGVNCQITLTEICYILVNILVFKCLVVSISLAPLSNIFTSYELPCLTFDLLQYSSFFFDKVAIFILLPPSFILYITCILLYSLLASFYFLCIMSFPVAGCLHVSCLSNIWIELPQIKTVPSHAKLCVTFQVGYKIWILGDISKRFMQI
jgi:hypothetical protein